MTDINKDLYPIQRFKLLGYLNQVERSNYDSVSKFTNLSYPEISRTVKFLEERGYVSTRKMKSGSYPETIIEISRHGQTEFVKLVNELRKFTT